MQYLTYFERKAASTDLFVRPSVMRHQSVRACPNVRYDIVGSLSAPPRSTCFAACKVKIGKEKMAIKGRMQQV